MKYYRYEDSRTTNGIHVYFREFDVIKETPRGVWIDIYGAKRFVLKEARKRYACPSKEEAKESFKARKTRQIKILTKQLENAKRALESVDETEDVNDLHHSW
jgi:hypothetical protein